MSMKMSANLELPKTYVRRIMKVNGDVHSVAMDSVQALSAATEYFISDLAQDSHSIALINNRKTIKIEDIIAAIEQGGSKYEFLKDAFGPVNITKQN